MKLSRKGCIHVRGYVGWDAVDSFTVPAVWNRLGNVKPALRGQE